ncbi:hypothetical protein OG985_49980 (plasmid) [Streptomyces sp. NBC_00289]|uniref:hypothetical protein n=1 Tax=Streptomyces sp. NBC_00289 TaxID=2975703 RepID=UPI002F90B2E1
MPQNTQTPKPVYGWFIPAQTTAPAKPKLSLLKRLALAAAAVLAIVLGSHTSADGQPATPSPGPSATTTGR